MLDFGLVREALHERGLLVQRLAPHLVRPVPFLYPLAHRVWERPYVGAGVLLYDMLGSALGSSRGLPRHRHLSRRAALREAPCLRPDALAGAVQYWDAQVDDARHTLAVVRTAVSYGALAANRTRVSGLLRDGERVTGARVIDLETGAEFPIRAKQVINATGVWTDQTQQLADTRGQFHVRASKGVHLVIPRDRLQSTTGIILRTETSVLFIIPWGRHWIIGTTDTDWNLDRAHPAASAADIDYLLDRVNAVLTSPLSRTDVQGVYAGLRPLLAGESESTSQLSREHVVAHPAPGLVVIAGGKYTTYRIMARDAVNEAARGMDAQVPASCTDTIPLIGADGWQAVRNQRHRLATQSGLHLTQIDHLLSRYGSLTHELLTLITHNPTLAQPLPGTENYLQAEAIYAVSHEGARHLDDILTRRTRTSIETWDRGISAAPVVTRLIAPLLDWNHTQQTNEIQHYLARVTAERQSQQQPDDTTADATRLSAPDIVPIDDVRV